MRELEDDLIYRDECYRLVGCCMEVHFLGILVNFGETSLQFKRFIV